MAITYFIGSEQRVGISNKSCLVYLKQDDPAVEYRRASLLLPLDQDANEAISTSLDNCWKQANNIVEQEFTRAKHATLADYYRNVLTAVAKAKANGGTLDVLIAVGLEAISKNGTAQAAFKEWQAFYTDSTPKVVLLQEIRLFALEGLQAGQ